MCGGSDTARLLIKCLCFNFKLPFLSTFVVIVLNMYVRFIRWLKCAGRQMWTTQCHQRRHQVLHSLWRSCDYGTHLWVKILVSNVEELHIGISAHHTNLLGWLWTVSIGQHAASTYRYHLTRPQQDDISLLEILFSVIRMDNSMESLFVFWMQQYYMDEFPVTRRNHIDSIPVRIRMYL